MCPPMELFSIRRWRRYWPKQKAVVFKSNPIFFATHAWHNSIVFWLMGRYSCFHLLLQKSSKIWSRWTWATFLITNVVTRIRGLTSIRYNGLLKEFWNVAITGLFSLFSFFSPILINNVPSKCSLKLPKNEFEPRYSALVKLLYFNLAIVKV